MGELVRRSRLVGRPLQPGPPLDVPLSLLSQTEPNTAGPVGRLVSMINCQVTKYLGATATPGVATGARVKLEQREAFRALTTTIRSDFDGSVITPSWGNAELLDSLDDQLVAICDSIPRVKSGSAFTGYPGARVVTRKLQQRVDYTADGIFEAPDSAWLAGVTCETFVAGGSLYVGFKADNGAWVTTPSFITAQPEVCKVVSDSVNFWLFYAPILGGTVVARAYDTNGVLLGTANVASTPDAEANFDVTSTSPGVLYAGPGASSHILFASVTISGGTVTVTANTDASTTYGDGTIGFARNPVNGLAYVAASNATALNGYEVTGLAATHAYAFPALPSVNLPPDSVIGWVDASLNMFVTVGILAPTAAQSVGPPNDPRYRQTITYECTRSGTASTVKTEYSVIPVSRAFQMDDDWYAVTYYQGGPGIGLGGTDTVTWTAGDFMKGAPIQLLAFAPNDFQYGNGVSVTTGSADTIRIGLDAVYTFNAIPPALAAMSNAQLAQIYQAGATITIANAFAPVNDGTFQIGTIQTSLVSGQLIIVCPLTTQVSENVTSSVVVTIAPSATSPNLVDSWNLGAPGFFPDASWIGENLFVSGTSQPANTGANAITDVQNIGGFRSVIKLGSSLDLQPEFIPNPVQPTAVLELQLADPTTAYEFFLQSVTFDQSFVGATISVQASGVPVDNTVYQIIQVTDAHHVIATPVNGSTNQVNRAFQSSVKINLSFPTNATASLQPTWFITPLAIPTQHTVGRFEYGIAYSDWRFDGSTDSPTNTYAGQVTSVNVTSAGLQVVLPYRAESFSAGVTAPTGNPVDTFFSTVGIKAFTLSNTPGQSLAVAGELIIPGPQASEFTSSSFAEQGINLGPEMPFLVSQSHDSGIALGLTPGTAYQYRVVFEFTDEDGDRIYTIPSPPLNVNLTSANNTITLGGNMLMPTQRRVTIAIYRTSIAGGSTTIQHYKITNDTTPFASPPFTFPDTVTWNFKDQRPDVEILVSETLYTDKGFTPRYPCPAFIQGVGTWRNRTWVIGYDGAVWMSGEKSEGDAVWFTPLFRYILPTDDVPQALAAMDDYLIVLGEKTNWYIPAVQFPDATANPASGQLPAPVQLPFANGCTGHAVTTRDGVIYSSTAGGAWLIPRNLTNGWLSQPIQQSLGLAPITGLAVDQNQRVLATIGNAMSFIWDTIPGGWYQWTLPSNALRVAEWQGNFVYLDGSRVMQHTPGSYADNIGGSDIAIPPSWTLAPLHLMGSVRGYGRTWAFQIQGEYMGPHFMNLTLGYGDEVDYQPPTVYPPFPAAANLSYLYEWNPKEEEASQFELSFSVTFPGGVAGNSATWELISFDVGVDQGIARVSPATEEGVN